MKSVSFFLVFFFCIVTQNNDDNCATRNLAFLENEEITMRVYYNTLGVYVGAGEAKFTTALTTYNGKTVYHCVGTGTTFSFFDNFYKVRDRYESYIDTATMLPVKFIRNVNEGNTTIYNNVTFNQKNQTAISTNGVFKVNGCVQDVMSMVYAARNINFQKYKPDDKIPFDIFLDDEVFHLYLRYEGKEVIKTKYGKFKALRLKPLLIKGSVFEGGEKMTVWVSDDPNHIILRVESPVSVGSVKIDMMGYRNLRHPLTSLISFK